MALNQTALQGPGRAFQIGDRVLVTGGYDQNPEWLQNADGYTGTFVEVEGAWALVELDDELSLDASPAGEGWADFGKGSSSEQQRIRTACGRWLALSQGWQGWEWREPVGRLHVGLCATKPDLRAIPRGGGIGAWVEDHATMKLLHAHDAISS